MLLPLMASADAVEIDGIYYNLIVKTKQAEVTSNPNKYQGEVAIPESVTYEGEKYSVTGIGGSAFYGCSSLTSVNTPNSVTSIGEYAFYYCSSLTSVSIGNSVTSIGYGAFYECRSLTSVTIPNSVTSIGSSAFYGCSSLTSVTIPNSVTSIGYNAFQSCSGLTSVTIPNSVTSIRDDAFMNCSGLISVTIPNSVTSIGDNAFRNCSGLTSIDIPNSVTSIGYNAFSGCSGLTSVTIPNSVIGIGGSAFADCSSLTSVSIGNSVISIGNQAFYKCRNLTSVTIPNSVTSIGESAFSECSRLTSVTIGNSVTSIGNSAFAKCAELTDFNCYAENIPSTGSNVFTNSEIGYATLHVPDASVENYKRTSPWSDFGTIVGLSGETPETPKCATPTIYYSQGKLSFACETEGVEFVSEIKDTDIKKNYESEVQLSVTYNISVYATKTGYDDSDVAEATLCWIEVDPQKEGITEETATDAKQLKAMPVLIQATDGQISVEGAPEGTKVAVYDASGVEVGTAISRGGTTLVPAHIASGSIAIVKIGEKAVKIKR